MAASRSDFYGLYFMPEATPGIDPGIIAADLVTGVCTGETYKFMPDATHKAWARMESAPSGLPKLDMKEVPQVFQTNDYDLERIKGLRSNGEVTLSFSVHGTILDTTAAPSTGDTDRPVAPPWLHLAGSAAGVILGYRTTDIGGPLDTVAALPTSGSVFSVTAGDAAEGLLLAHSLAATPTILKELFRPTAVTAGTDLTAATYNTAEMGLVSTPTATDKIRYPVQGVFDNRLADHSETFTLLMTRPDSDSAIMLLGAQAKSWVITSGAGDLPVIKIVFTYRKWSSYADAVDDAVIWTAEPVIDEEPDYYAQWPCPAIVSGGHFYYQNPDDNSIKRDTLDISAVEISWNSGLDRYMANTGTEGVAGMLVKNKQELSFKFTCLYQADFRVFLNAACYASGVADSFPLIYWEGDVAGHNWFFSMASAFLKEDPGFDGADGGLQAQTLNLGFRKYAGDDGVNPWDGTEAADTKFGLGAFA